MALAGGKRRYLGTPEAEDRGTAEDISRRAEEWMRLQGAPFSAVMRGMRHHAVCRADGLEIAETVTGEAADAIVLGLNALARELGLVFEKQHLRAEVVDKRLGFRLDRHGRGR